MLLDSSGFPSKRINLSPFTKDFRGGEQLSESVTHFLLSLTLVGTEEERLYVNNTLSSVSSVFAIFRRF